MSAAITALVAAIHTQEGRQLLAAGKVGFVVPVSPSSSFPSNSFENSVITTTEYFPSSHEFSSLSHLRASSEVIS